MSVESVLVTRLSGFAGLTALIGTTPPRLYYGEMPQKTALPAVSYGRVTAQRVPAMGADTGLVRARFQFDVWAANAKSARQVVEQLRLALQRWSNTSGTVIQDIHVAGDVDLGLDPDTLEHHSAIDFEVVYVE